jgi:hypothetical protein
MRLRDTCAFARSAMRWNEQAVYDFGLWVEGVGCWLSTEIGPAVRRRGSRRADLILALSRAASRTPNPDCVHECASSFRHTGVLCFCAICDESFTHPTCPTCGHQSYELAHFGETVCQCGPVDENEIPWYERETHDGEA